METGLESRRIIRREEVTRLTGIARATLYKLIKEGRFPSPLRLGERSVGWRLADIDAWLAAPERRWDPKEVR